MTPRAIASLLPHLEGLLVRGRDGRGDAELLEGFLARRDEAAFAALLRRHGPMVLAVCRRLLHDPGDADDAFQATFLVLVRKARSIRRPERLGAWLYGVAHRTALKARTARARRRRLEHPLPDLPVEGDLAQLVWRDVRPVLDEELRRLPEKLRAPVVLCFLEGLSKREAARRLGWPEGTLSTRLHEARQVLRRRLTRRGLTLTPAVLALALVEGAAPAAVPASLAAAVGSAAAGFACGQASALSAPVAALTQGVLREMFLCKLKLSAAALALAGMLFAGVGAALTRTRAAAPQEQAKAPDNPPAEKGPPAKPPRGEKEAPPQKFALGPDVLQIVWSPDGVRFATSTRGGTGPTAKRTPAVKIYEARTAREVAAFSVPRDVRVLGLDFSPSGATLAVGYRRAIDKRDLWIELRDARTADRKQVIAIDPRGALGQFAFSPDGKVIAGTYLGPGDLDPKVNRLETGVHFWDAGSGRVIRSIPTDDTRPQSLAYSRDGKLIATGGEAVRLWEVQTGKRVWVARMTTRVARITFSPDGKTIAAAGEGRVVLLDAATGEESASLPDACDRNQQPAFSPDGRFLLGNGTSTKERSRTGEARLWDLRSRKLLRSWADTRGNAAFSADAKNVYVLGGDGTLRVWPIGGPVWKPVVVDLRQPGLLDQLAGKKSDEQVVDAIFLVTLGRFPTEIEGKTARALLAKKKEARRAAIEDLLFALKNSREYFSRLDSLRNDDPRKKK
jgi:RNA polymerase sigma factor (sigma-70 family)